MHLQLLKLIKERDALYGDHPYLHMGLPICQNFLTENTPSKNEKPWGEDLFGCFILYMDTYPHIGLLICQNFWTESSPSRNGRTLGWGLVWILCVMCTCRISEKDQDQWKRMPYYDDYRIKVAMKIFCIFSFFSSFFGCNLYLLIDAIQFFFAYSRDHW